jgi:hypothetical protein
MDTTAIAKFEFTFREEVTRLFDGEFRGIDDNILFMAFLRTDALSCD